MKKGLVFLLLFVPFTTYAYYDKSCLSDCFSSGHDCNFCAYQCWKEDGYQLTPNYDGDNTCPLNSNEIKDY